MAPLYFLVYCVFTSALVSGQSIRYELVGQEVNLKPDISGQPDQILWMHNGNKVVEFDGKEQQVYGSYAGRVTLDWISAELLIRDLRYEDSGDYESAVFMDIKLLRSRFTVEVIDKVSKPTISCQVNGGSSSDTPKLQATLMCSADSRRPQSLMKFEWISNVNVQPGPKLTIPLRSKQDDEVYSCRVRNPLTQETANFIAKDCYPDESSNVPLVASLGAAFAVSFIALVVLGILFCKRQHKACFAKREDGRTDLCEMRPLLNSAPTCPSPQQLTQEELQGDRQPEGSDVRIDLSNEMRPLLNGAPASSQQHNHQMPPEGSDESVDVSDGNGPPFNRAPTYPSPQKLIQDERPPEGKVKHRKQFKPLKGKVKHRKQFKPLKGKVKHRKQLESLKVKVKDRKQLESLKVKAKDRKQFYKSLKGLVVSAKRLMELFERTNAECTSPPDTPTESVKADEDKESLEDTDSDQVTGEPAEESDRESDSSHLEKINGPHDSSEEKQSSAVPEEKGPEITVQEQDSNLPQHETHTQEDEHQEMNKQVSGVRNESENDTEDVNKELTSSQLPQIPTEPENHNTDTAHTHPDKEEGDKTRHESDASEEQSDNGTAEANRGEGESEAAENDDQCDENKEQETDGESEAVKTT